MLSRSILFTRDLTLDVSVRNRNGRFIFSKYCTMAGTRHTARGNPIYVQANAASRHAVSICQSTWFYCPPQWLLTKSYLSFSILFPSSSPSLSPFPSASYFLLFVHQTEPSCCSTATAVVAAVCAGSRKSQINPFVIPHRSFQPVRISTTRFYATSASSRNSSSFLLRLPVVLSREKTTISSLSFFLSSPFLDSHYPIFIYFFFLLLPLVFRCILTNPRTRSVSPFFCIFSPYIPSPISRNLSSGQRFNRVCFVCFSCVNLNSNFLAIQAYRHYDIWRRGLRLKEGFVRVSKLRSSQSRTPTGIGRHAKRRTRQRDLLKQREQKRFFKLFVFLFLAKSRTIHSVPSSFFWYNYRAIITSSSVFSFGSDHRSFELCRAMPRLLIVIKERQFGKYEKIRNFFLPKRKRFSSSSHHVTFIRLMSSHFLP